MGEHQPRAGDGGADVARALLFVHLGALLLWLAAKGWAVRARAGARRERDPGTALSRHRAAMRPLRVEQAAFLLALCSGALLMLLHGWAPTRARWLGVKLGLVAFLLVPLEGLHLLVADGWLARGLREARPEAPSRLLERGLGVEEMVRTLELILFTPAVPLIVWLSLAEPF